MSDVLLVHGSCHGAWCWRDLVPALQDHGHTVRAIDLPGHGQNPAPIQDVTLDAYAHTIAEACRGDTVVVGHSLGGYSITAAAEIGGARLSKLIYLCAYVPMAGKTLAEMRFLAPRQPLLAAIDVAEDGLSVTVKPDKAIEVFYQDCDPDTAQWAAAQLGPQATEPYNQVITLTEASQSLPRRFIRCMDDQTIPPEFQVTMTEDWPPEHVQDMPCGHSPFLADPTGLARALDHAIRT